MSLHQRSFVAIVVLLTAIGISGCTNKGGPNPTAVVTPIQITVEQGSGACLQNGAKNTNIPMDGSGVSWSTSNAVSLEVHVNPGANACPFAGGCDFPASTNPIPSGAANAPKDQVFTYSSIKVNGIACGVGTDGLVMR